MRPVKQLEPWEKALRRLREVPDPLVPNPIELPTGLPGNLFDPFIVPLIDPLSMPPSKKRKDPPCSPTTPIFHPCGT